MKTSLEGWEVGLRDLWRKYKDWFAVLVFISVLIGYTIWYLHLNPQHIHLFLTTAIISLGFVVVMALLPKYRQRLVKGILEYHAKGKERGGWLYRYQKVAIALVLISTLTLPIIWRYQLIPSQYIPFYAITFLIINLTSGAILIAGMLKTIGKWVLLLIGIGLAIAILRILTWSR